MSSCDGREELMASSIEKTTSDLEILEAAFPDEVQILSLTDGITSADFPLKFRLKFDQDSYIELQLPFGYPSQKGLEVVSYRSSDADKKSRMDAVAASVRRVAKECLEDQIEACMGCCSEALEVWNDETLETRSKTTKGFGSKEQNEDLVLPVSSPRIRKFAWISGEPLTDRKSTFQGHACRVESELQVYEAMRELIEGSNRIQRAYHNMYAWRLTEQPANEDGPKPILKHDNDDDGEDAAGGRLAQLLHSRQDDGVVVVVSRWYGGIKLGPKRFAHITNCAREVLVKLMHQDSSKSSSSVPVGVRTTGSNRRKKPEKKIKG